MQAFSIRYRNTQGTLMRILNAASRRGLDMPSVQAEPAEKDHRATLLLEVNQKQVGQLYREWYAIADVIHVGTVTTERTNMIGWASPYGPSSENARDGARAARA